MTSLDRTTMQFCSIMISQINRFGQSVTGFRLIPRKACKKYGLSAFPLSVAAHKKRQNTLADIHSKNGLAMTQPNITGGYFLQTSKSNSNQNTQPCRSNQRSATPGLVNIKTIATRAISSLRKVKNSASRNTTTNCSPKKTPSSSPRSNSHESKTHTSGTTKQHLSA